MQISLYNNKKSKTQPKKMAKAVQHLLQQNVLIIWVHCNETVSKRLNQNSTLHQLCFLEKS